MNYDNGEFPQRCGKANTVILRASMNVTDAVRLDHIDVGEGPINYVDVSRAARLVCYGGLKVGIWCFTLDDCSSSVRDKRLIVDPSDTSASTDVKIYCSSPEPYNPSSRCYLYYASYSDGGIRRAPLWEPRSTPELVIPPSPFPGGNYYYFDVDDEYLYWVDNVSAYSVPHSALPIASYLDDNVTNLGPTSASYGFSLVHGVPGVMVIRYQNHLWLRNISDPSDAVPLFETSLKLDPLGLYARAASSPSEATFYCPPPLTPPWKMPGSFAPLSLLCLTLA